MGDGAHAFLRSEQGCILTLGVQDETWIGRGSFQVARQLQLQCSRRQARIFYQDGSFHLQCHGTNPLYFVRCQSVNFRLKDSVGPYHSVKKGEVVKLTSEDQFYFIKTECLLTFLSKPPQPWDSSVPCSVLGRSDTERAPTAEEVSFELTKNSGDCQRPLETTEEHADAEAASVRRDIEPFDAEGYVHNEEAVFSRSSDITELSAKEQETYLRMEERTVVITLEDSEDERSSLPAQTASNEIRHGPVPRMEDVIVTVTGYTGTERAKLVGLINKCGAVYSGDLLSSHTHLVCWKFSGKKYDQAKQWGTVIINHQWLEDSLEAGCRLPEERYTLKCGQEVGPVKYDAEFLTASQSSGGNDETNATRRERKKNEDFKMRNRRSESSSIEFMGTQTSYLKELDVLLKKEKTAKRLLGQKDKQRHWRSELIGTQTSYIKDLDALLQEDRQTGERSLRGKEKNPQLQNGRPGCSSELIRTQSRFLKEPIVSLQDGGAARNRLVHGKEKENEDPQLQSRRSQIVVLETHRGSLQSTDLHKLSGRAREAQDPGSSSSQLRRGETKVLDQPKQGDTYNCLLRRQKCKREKTAGASLTSAPRLKQQKVETYVRVSAQIESTTQDNSAICEPIPIVETCGGSDVVACVICHAEERSPLQGVLACGHDFCFDCIRKWARQNESKGPVCPLCKAPFDLITRRDMVNTEQFSETIIMVKRPKANVEQRFCIICRGVDTDELLVVCRYCRARAVHTFCLDPPWDPRYPWQCNLCLDQSIYR